MAALPAPVEEAADRGRAWLRNTTRLIHRYGQAEWFGSPLHLMGLARPRASGLAAAPRSPRPVSLDRGGALLIGTITLAGQTMQVGPGGDPFDKPSPSRPFAEALHAFDWLGDLMATGEAGEKDALRLALDWRRVFGRWNSFSWSGPRLERRVINLACHLRRIAVHASELETQQLSDSLARQARQLLLPADGPAREAERACAAALGGAALAGPAGEKLMAKALVKLQTALPVTVLPDGGHASRSPQAGLDLLLDLLTLDDGLSQRGRAQPEAMGRAIDRLSAALRFFILPDGRLPCFQGGEEGHADDVTAARAASDLPDAPPPTGLPQTGYQRMSSRRLTLIADAAGPAPDDWSETALAQPCAIEILCGPDRLITNCGWSPLAQGPQSHRLTSAGSTLAIGDRSAGEPVGGRLGGLLGERLKNTAPVIATRHEAPQGSWLELYHDAWVPAWGLRHERRLYLDHALDELRGEDRMVALTGVGAGRLAPVTIRFHLAPGVKVSMARDQHSVLIQGPGTPPWWLRNDAAEVTVEPSVHYQDGQPRRCSQVVLRSPIPADTGGRVRWKLAKVEQA
jgi:uncharacterized heparinase superfamily protein